MSEYTPVKSNVCFFSTTPASASSKVILAENLQRKGGSIVNASESSLYLRMDGGIATTTTGFNVVLGENDYFEIPVGYTGVISGIWAGTGGSANIAEYV